MSSVATNDTDTSTHVTDPVEGGSPGDWDTRVDDEGEGEPKVEQAEGGAETDEQKVGEGEEPKPEVSDDKVSELTEQLEELKSELAKRDEVLAAIDAEMQVNPALRKMLSGGRGADADEHEDPLVNALSTIDQTFLPDSASGLKTLMKPVFDELLRLRKEVATVKPSVQQLARTHGQSRFTMTLAENGVGADVQVSKPFQKLLKEMRHDREFQSLEARNPEFAARYAADRWTAKRARTNGWKDEQSRIATAKGGKNGSAPGRGASTAVRVVEVEIDPDIDYIAKADGIRREAERAKENVRIKYVPLKD